MKKAMLVLTLVSILLTGAFCLLYACFPYGTWLTAAISCGTTAYHFLMRLAVGYAFQCALHNRVNVRHPWFRTHKWEERLFRLLRVDRWRGRMPTYDPDAFSPRLHTWEEIASAMCQAELVHETIVLFSFLPVFATCVFGDFWIFFATSLAAACYDMMFVMMQRHCRPRVLSVAERQRKRSARHALSNSVCNQTDRAKL